MIQKIKLCLSTLMLTWLVSFSTCLADECIFLSFSGCFNDVNVIEGKIYIQPDDIYFSPNQIYVRMAEDLIPVPHLDCDGNGFFVLAQDMQAGAGWGRQGTWICPIQIAGMKIMMA